jgi:hypothetical protein
VIDCGNAQQQQISYASTGFSSNCLYDKKGDYVWKALLTYDNKITGEKGITMELAQGKLSFVSEIQLFLTTQNAKSSTPLSATQGEINLGKAPAKITVDATSIFRDFGLKDYQVVRDMDNDNGYDREQMVSFDYIYKMPQVYNPTVKFPALNDFIYSFPVRVEQSDVPICEINLANFSQTKYKIQTNFLDGSVSSIAGYTYHILDTSTNKEIATLKQSTREVDYTFPEKGNYIVSLDFITVDGKRGTCESELLQLAKEDIIVTYVIKQKLPGETVFKEISASAISGGVIALDTIPQAIVIDLVSVSPDSVSMRKNVFFEGKPVLNQGSLYEFTLDQERVYEVVIRLEDSERALFKEIPLSLVVKRPDIVGKLVVEPNAGYEPLKVRFDASQSLVTIPADEIIYFSWDFGDGESKINLPNGVIEHTYKYNHERESGSFQPSVVITTRKGYTTTVQPDLPILVKKQLIQVNLSSTSHPTQSAKLGDSVHFLAEFNGLPETMKRDFGDGSTPVQCKGRGCAEVNKIFELPGTYTVKLSLTFEDTQTVETTLGFNVR